MAIARSLLRKVLPPDSVWLGPPSRLSGTAKLPGWGKGAKRGETRPCLQRGLLCWQSSLWKLVAAPGIFTGLGAVQRKHRRGIFLDALCAQRTKPGCGLKAISLLGMFEKLNKGLSFRDMFDMMGCSIFGKMMAISGLSIVAKTPGGACPQDCWS